MIDIALAEDLGHGDITTDTIIPPELQGRASLLAKAEGIVAGGEVAKRVFLRVDPSLIVEMLIKDGTSIRPRDIIATVSGKIASILKAERTALNFLGKLSGVATDTSRYVAEVQGFPTIILDTRKTTPGLRTLEKYAVRVGGGQNHRLHLGSWILIKDNHLAALRSMGMSMKDIVAKAKQHAPHSMTVQVEATTVQEALDAVEGGVDMIMLDNMNADEMRQAVNVLPDHIKTEASGGVTLDNVRAAAMAGVDYISSGAFIHSVKTLNLSLELEAATLRL
jgi:nicotinate-nucleotide pyrophosphorylase (carboxylating)